VVRQPDRPRPDPGGGGNRGGDRRAGFPAAHFCHPGGRGTRHRAGNGRLPSKEDLLPSPGRNERNGNKGETPMSLTDKKAKPANGSAAVGSGLDESTASAGARVLA